MARRINQATAAQIMTNASSDAAKSTNAFPSARFQRRVRLADTARMPARKSRSALDIGRSVVSMLLGLSPNAERLARATTVKGYSPASPLQALCCRGLGNLQVAANLSRKNIFDFIVPRHGRGTMRRAIDIHCVFFAFAKQFAAASLKVTNKRLAFHAAESETASRITSCPAISSSDSARFASNTSSIDSSRFDLASSSVSP